MAVTTEPRHNRLFDATSPYLQQHALNPVDWYPWGEEALWRAKALDRPILLSIGYAACHWCHVMERESFENEAIARLLNEHFVAIKVDREERPDLDDIYMAATVAMTGAGGWPMNVFLTPDQKPFFAGTYFPPVERFGRPSFPMLLSRIADMWTNNRSVLLLQADQVTAHLKNQAEPGRYVEVDASVLARAAEQLDAIHDDRHGGFSGAPKFPPPAQISVLLRYHAESGDRKALDVARRTLDAMKNGGIYDHLGGGFARYATDQRWLVPHFEKMLYDNAQLAAVYLEAYQVTRDPEYRRVATETLDYVLREMQSPEGGFFSSTDADSDGEEGKFFVWTLEELQQLLGTELATRFGAYYGVRRDGNWEDGKNILHTPRPREDVARELGIAASELEASLARGRSLLLAARQQRTPPSLDDKVLTAWNALMIGALALGYRVLRDQRYLDAAERAARFVRNEMHRPDGGLYRSFRGGRAELGAYLEDYGYLADALVSLYEAGAPESRLFESLRVAERMVQDFWDEHEETFFNTAHDHEMLLFKPREGHDGATPNPSAVAARALVRLSRHLGRADFQKIAERLLISHGESIDRFPRAYPVAVGVIHLLSEPPTEVTLVGRPGEPGYEALALELAGHYLPNGSFAHADPDHDPRAPLAQNKPLVNGNPAAYVCSGFVCKPPATTRAALRALLSDQPKSGTDTRGATENVRPLL